MHVAFHLLWLNILQDLMQHFGHFVLNSLSMWVLYRNGGPWASAAGQLVLGFVHDLILIKVHLMCLNKGGRHL